MEYVALVVSGITGLLAVILGFLSATRKRDVDSFKVKMEQVHTDYKNLEKRAERCDQELHATRQMFRDTEERMRDRVEALLVELAVKKRDGEK
jgi:hypothetical protein